MSDTPETDKAERMAFASEYMVPTEFARELERERDEARDQRNRLHELHNQNAIHHNELLELCVTLRKERDEAQNASEAFSALAWKLEGERNEAREALDRASLYISNFTGSCPYDLFNIEPHDSPCSEVCDKYANDMHLCWKKHFANKEAAK